MRSHDSAITRKIPHFCLLFTLSLREKNHAPTKQFLMYLGQNLINFQLASKNQATALSSLNGPFLYPNVNQKKSSNRLFLYNSLLPTRSSLSQFKNCCGFNDKKPHQFKIYLSACSPKFSLEKFKFHLDTYSWEREK